MPRRAALFVCAAVLGCGEDERVAPSSPVPWSPGRVGTVEPAEAPSPHGHLAPGRPAAAPAGEPDAEAPPDATPPEPQPEPTEDPDGGPDPTEEPDDDPPDDPASYPQACGPLYAQDLLPHFHVEIAEEEWDALQDEYANWRQREANGLPLKPYHPIVFRYGDEVVPDAMIRLKGTPKNSWIGPKMQFVIAFNQVRDDGRFWGLRKLSLDAPHYDPTLLKDRIGMAFFRDLGVPAPCVNNALLSVNGGFYGVFANIEYMNKDFLDRAFEQDDGNLYKEGWELETNEETGDTRGRDAFWGARDVDQLDDAADLEQMVQEWAGEALVPHADGFFVGSGNFYLYEHPERGMLMLPWDLDLSFEELPATIDPATYRSPRRVSHEELDMVLADPYWYGRYVRAVERALEAYDVDRLRDRLHSWNEQIAEDVERDPNLPSPLYWREEKIERLDDYVGERAAFVRGWLEEQ